MFIPFVIGVITETQLYLIMRTYILINIICDV